MISKQLICAVITVLIIVRHSVTCVRYITGRQQRRVEIETLNKTILRICRELNLF